MREMIMKCSEDAFDGLCEARNISPEEAAASVVSRQDGFVVFRATRGGKTAAVESPGLGDRVAAGLAAVGITKERVSKAIGRDCGCAKRQAALNKLGQQTAAAFKRLTGGAHDAETETSEQVGRVENRDA